MELTEREKRVIDEEPELLVIFKMRSLLHYLMEGVTIEDYETYLTATELLKVFPMFYQFITFENKIIIIGELCAFCLLNNQIIWENNFDEIIDFYSLNGIILSLKNYDSSIIKIDITSGKII